MRPSTPNTTPNNTLYEDGTPSGDTLESVGAPSNDSSRRKMTFTSPLDEVVAGKKITIEVAGAAQLTVSTTHLDTATIGVDTYQIVNTDSGVEVSDDSFIGVPFTTAGGAAEVVTNLAAAVNGTATATGLFKTGGVIPALTNGTQAFTGVEASSTVNFYISTVQGNATPNYITPSIALSASGMSWANSQANLNEPSEWAGEFQIYATGMSENATYGPATFSPTHNIGFTMARATVGPWVSPIPSGSSTHSLIMQAGATRLRLATGSTTMGIGQSDQVGVFAFAGNESPAVSAGQTIDILRSGTYGGISLSSGAFSFGVEVRE